MTSKIKIKYRTQAEFFLLILSVYPFVFQFFITELKFPSAIKYLTDCLLLLVAFINFPKLKIFYGKTFAYGWTALFLSFTLIGYIVNYQSIFFYIWGIRNNFRFYLYFILCIITLKKKDIDFFYKFIDIIFYVNVFVVTFQYFVLNYRRDYLGGLFGTSQGCNGFMNIFLVIVFIKSVLFYINSAESLSKCIIKTLFVVYISALSELKFMFAEIIIIVLLSMLITKFTWKKVGLILLTFLALLLGVNILVLIFPEWKGYFSVEGFLRIAASKSGYTGSGDLNRLTGVFTISQNYFESIKDFIFGYGLGNCDHSSAFSLLDTPFYNKYSWLNYTWFSTTFIYFEMGIIGLLMFFSLYVIIFFKSRKITDSLGEYKYVGQMAQVLSIVCIFIAIYNSSLRIESAYMMYLFLAFPFIKEIHNNNTVEQGEKI